MSVQPEAFIEQAEYLDRQSFIDWGADHPDESAILRKLTQGGAKLISGPRGCGKTTLMLKAYNKLLKDQAVLPVYVNFKRSLVIEPLYAAGDKGTYVFNQWILLKMYEGLYRTIGELGESIFLSIDAADAAERIAALEMSRFELIPGLDLNINRLELDLLRVIDKCNRARCVLLLDDAAHAFSAEQQRDFFDFFRQIKSREVSPKAAVYPGVTSYSSSFHVGHDAEEIDVWVKPDRPGYIEFMRRVVESRFPPSIYPALYADREVLDFLCYSTFGIPRAFLNILQAVVDSSDDGDETFRGFKRRAVLQEVKQHYQNTLKLFRSLKDKVPTYRNFIEHGEVVLTNAIDLVKEYNRSKSVGKQSVSIAINASDMTPELVRLFSLFQYAGLCISKGVVSRGEKGRFEIYVLHYSALISANALLGKKAVNLGDYVTAFASRDAHEFTRVSPSTLTGGKNVATLFELSLPPCSVCGAPRNNRDARFCANCGSKLTLSSTYTQLISQDIAALPLTEARVAKIKEQSSIRQVKDILLDKEHRELRGVDRIGPYWAGRIVRLAEEFVE
ncbi:AAA family ATPase [Dyella sp. GSA-30]|uniref:AAA family ATPase n=1 Tax=Dyella sp. GSA-30 TaxID=2994496 RepID=UPI002491354D|nr:AAA family ATPase [Dyella sp. GSA-30]BDU19436.1 hypothetical protein DYGSA30_08930 [Dyella sp. GSA-30]